MPYQGDRDRVIISFNAGVGRIGQSGCSLRIRFIMRQDNEFPRHRPIADCKSMDKNTVDFATATVLSTWGSAPRDIGSFMVRYRTLESSMVLCQGVA